MPLKGNPVCLKCETSESPIWTNAENLGAICLNCVNEAKDEIRSDEENDDDSKTRKKLRTRSYKTRLNPFALPKTTIPKGRGRRAVTKKIPYKAPSAVATPVTSDNVFYKVNNWFIILVPKPTNVCDLGELLSNRRHCFVNGRRRLHLLRTNPRLLDRSVLWEKRRHHLALTDTGKSTTWRQFRSSYLRNR